MTDQLDTQDAPAMPIPDAASGAPSVGNYQQGLDFIKNQQQGLGKTSADLYKKLQSDTDAGNQAVAKATADYKKIAQAAPEYEKAPPSPDLEVKKLSAGAGIAALVSGMIVGKLAHTNPFMTGVDATNAAFKAQATNDKNAREAALKNWQAAISGMKDHNAQMKQVYDDAVELAKTDVTGAQALLKNGLSAYASGMNQVASQQKSLQELFKTYDASMRQMNHTQEINQRAATAFERQNGKATKPVDASSITLQDYFGWKETPNLSPKDAADLADKTDTIGNLDSIARTVRQNPTLATELQKTLQQAEGNTDTWLGILQEKGSQDAQAFAKQYIEIARAAAQRLAGSRGIGVGIDKLAKGYIGNVNSPEALASLAELLATETKNRMPSHVYSKSGESLPLDFSRMAARPTTPEALRNAESKPIVGKAERKIVRTGTDKTTGKKVVQYDDGTIEAQ